MVRCAAVIEVDHLSKLYRVHRRGAGLGATLRSLLHRRYEEVRAVDDVSFSIAAGERVGFLGPNGAGKTTTLKVLSGLLHPTGGTVRVAGHVPQKREVQFLKSITLVMGQKQQLLWDLPPLETFALNRAIYDIPRSDFDAILTELIDLLGLGGLVERPTRQLSLGERMKCELCAALLHRPGVLFLDEPTLGLDVTMQATIRSFIQRYNERYGATVLLTSHYMDDVVALCPRVIVIDKGRINYDGDLSQLVRRVRPNKHVVVKLAHPVSRAQVAAIARVVAPAEGAKGADGEIGVQATLEVPQPQVSKAVSRALAELPVVDLVVEDPPLEEVMRELFAGRERGRA
jgi:ABC-2 type transport system ATP-binding protein